MNLQFTTSLFSGFFEITSTNKELTICAHLYILYINVSSKGGINILSN